MVKLKGAIFNKNDPNVLVAVSSSIKILQEFCRMSRIIVKSHESDFIDDRR